jgi:hypothetical protein
VRISTGVTFRAFLTLTDVLTHVIGIEIAIAFTVFDIVVVDTMFVWVLIGIVTGV